MGSVSHREESLKGPEKAMPSSGGTEKQGAGAAEGLVWQIPETPGGRPKPGWALSRGLPNDTCTLRYPTGLRLEVFGQKKDGYTFKVRKNTG